ncbi:hypothetical protein ACWEFL_06135 [Streptomyces sp. NPDC004838]
MSQTDDESQSSDHASGTGRPGGSTDKGEGVRPRGSGPDGTGRREPHDAPVAFAEETLAVLARQTADEGDQVIGRLIEQTVQEAHDLRQVASSPVTMGVVGEFSNGKSLLIGTLLGRPDVLPVEVRACTGNVTALHLSQGPPGEHTRLSRDAVVEFLTREGARECAAFMLGELAHKVRQDLPHLDLRALDGYDPFEDDWRGFEEWARRTLWTQEADNPRHRRLAHELLLFRDACLGDGTLFGATVQPSAALLNEALDLGDITEPPREFPVRPGIRHSVRRVADSATDLRAAFPLIRRVTYRVSVDPGAWNLGRLAGERDLVLLDFPGLGSESSGSRDAYLSHSELADVSTILIVLDADEPNAGTPLDFYGMLQRHGRSRSELEDSVLVAGNKFDAVPVPPLPDGRLSAEDLRAASQHIKGFDVTGRELVQGRHDRVLPVSAIAGIAAHGYTYSEASDQSRHEVRRLLSAHRAARSAPAPDTGDPFDFSDPFSDPAGPAGPVDNAAGPPGWTGWTDRISENFPNDAWARRLSAYETDGGITALRALIEEHVVRHGVRLKNMRVGKRVRTLTGLLEKLAALTGGPGGEDDEALRRADNRLRELRSTLQRLDHDLNQLRDPTSLTHGSGVSLLELLRRQAVVEVFAWPEWHSLANRMQNGTITVGDGAARTPGDTSDDPFGDDPFGGDSPGGDPFDNELSGAADAVYNTAAFRREFDATVNQLAEETFVHVHQWAIDFARTWNERLDDLNTWWADDETEALLAVPLAELDGPNDVLRKRMIGKMTDVSWIPEKVKERVLRPAHDAADIGAEPHRRFPQRDDHDLPWNSSVAARLNTVQAQVELHQMRAFRMRREMAEAVAEACTGLLLDLLEEVRAYLSDQFRRAQARIPVGRQLRQRSAQRARHSLFRDTPEPAAGPAEPYGKSDNRGDGEDGHDGGIPPLLDHLAKWGLDT